MAVEWLGSDWGVTGVLEVDMECLEELGNAKRQGSTGSFGSGKSDWGVPGDVVKVFGE